MKKLIIIAILTVAAVGAQAQTSQFSQPTYLTGATNSGTLATAVTTVIVPSISLTITATNNATVVTNTLFAGLTVGATTLPKTVFIYSAATYGTNFSTNWPSYSISVTNFLTGQASPQAGGSNTCYIQ